MLWCAETIAPRTNILPERHSLTLVDFRADHGTRGKGQCTSGGGRSRHLARLRHGLLVFALLLSFHLLRGEGRAGGRGVVFPQIVARFPPSPDLRPDLPSPPGSAQFTSFTSDINSAHFTYALRALYLLGEKRPSLGENPKKTLRPT